MDDSPFHNIQNQKHNSKPAIYQDKTIPKDSDEQFKVLKNEDFNSVTLVDFSYLIRRNAESIANNYKIKNGKVLTEEIKKEFLTSIMFALQGISNEFSDRNNRTQLILCLDSKPYWRNDVFWYYKGSRKGKTSKSKINWGELFNVSDSFLERIKEIFPFYVISSYGAEGDCIVSVLSSYITKTLNKPVNIWGIDHDFHQLLINDETKLLRILNPKDNTFFKLEPHQTEVIFNGASRFLLEHIIRGDKGDDVPRCIDMMNYSQAFESYLIGNKDYIVGIVGEDKYLEIIDGDERTIHFNKMTKKTVHKIISKYDVKQKFIRGKNVGKDKEDLDIWEPNTSKLYMTKKNGKGILDSEENLKTFLKSSPIIKANFFRNATLVDLRMIPKDLKNDIINNYNNLEFSFDKNKVKEFMVENESWDLLKWWSVGYDEYGYLYANKK